MWRWVKDHALLVGLAFIGLFGVIFLVFGRGTDKKKVREGLSELGDKLTLEKQVIDEKAKVAKLTAKEGHRAAADKVQQDHAEKIAKLDDDQKKKVEELAHDPEGLVDFVLRTSA